MKNRVTGLGGFFFKTKNPDQIKEWYKTHLGIPTDQYGWTFWWHDKDGKKCSTQWSPFEEKSEYFSPSDKPFMMNFRVENLTELLETLKEEGVTIVGEIEEYEYGKFGWILDPENNKIELWEPKDSVFLENN
ncbi:VOC family protein [Leeuwenhoekiella sp. W20_SRS_FM14]|uniref:VOC family protein n=1 Tax=Leeuwenhoekiella sp. W20_SRS_FM14 TaxID=3240270 RepID=UPI003F9C2C64